MFDEQILSYCSILLSESTGTLQSRGMHFSTDLLYHEPGKNCRTVQCALWWPAAQVDTMWRCIVFEERMRRFF